MTILLIMHNYIVCLYAVVFGIDKEGKDIS